VSAASATRLPRWTLVAPPAAIVVLIGASVLPESKPLEVISVIALVGAVMAAVRLAEIVALRVGEPLGALVLSVSVTVIEIMLIVRLMLFGGRQEVALARDTVFAVIMIVCNGLIGLCLLIGGLRYREQSFTLSGASASLATLIAIATLALVLPNFATTAPGPFYTESQLIFAGSAALLLWGALLFMQGVRHRDYFLAPTKPGEAHPTASRAPPPALTGIALMMMLIALAAVIGLARRESPHIEAAIEFAGAPKGAVGVAIAILVLLPELVSSVRDALADHVQASINEGLGAALASVGLTIPAVAFLSVYQHSTLLLGLDAKDMVLLALTFLLLSVTFVSGRTNAMMGLVHLVVFATFVMLALVP